VRTAEESVARAPLHGGTLVQVNLIRRWHRNEMSESETVLATAQLTSGEGYEQQVRVRRHQLVADEPERRGGHDAGPTPAEFILAGLAACTSITLHMYAEKHAWQIGELRVDLQLHADGETRRIDRVLRFSPETSLDQRGRLAAVAEKTPVTRALREGMPIATTIAEP